MLFPEKKILWYFYVLQWITTVWNWKSQHANIVIRVHLLIYQSNHILCLISRNENRLLNVRKVHSKLNSIRRKGNSENPCSGLLFFLFFFFLGEYKKKQIRELQNWACEDAEVITHCVITGTDRGYPQHLPLNSFTVTPQRKPALISCGTLDLPSSPNDLIITFRNLKRGLLDGSLFVSAWIIHLMLYIVYRQNFLVS